MAKGKRKRRAQEFDFEYHFGKRVELGYAFSKFELPEVDNIRQEEAPIFGNLPTNSSSSSSTTNALHNKKTNKDKDRISKLPSDILEFITSFLTMREQARTSILSTCWRNIWCTSISCLDFSHANLFGYDYPKFEDQGFYTDQDFLMDHVVNFRQRVDQVLQTCQSSRFDALRISFLFGKESTSHIDKWVKFVAARGVKQLQLDFAWSGYVKRHSYSNEYTFPVQEFGSSLNYLHLKNCIFEFPCKFKGFKSLVSMTLDNIILGEHAVQNILSNCSSLEWLSLIRCYFCSMASLKFAGPSLLLKHLHIGFMGTTEPKIDVHDINILSLEFDGCISTKNISLKNTPHLARFVFTYPITGPFEILSSLAYVEILFVSGWFTEHILPKLDGLRNLKRLVFLSLHSEVNLHQLVDLLEACPSLQKLELDMGDSSTRNTVLSRELTKMIKRPGIPLTSLKEIEIYGFQDYPGKIELARYLLKNATVLEKMKLYKTSREYLGNGKWIVFENNWKQGTISSKKICKLLQKEVSSSTELIVESLY